MWKDFSVRSTSLKRLTFYTKQRCSRPKSVSFETPNITCLDYSEVHAVKYPKVNLDSLVEARINIWMTSRDVWKVKNMIEQGNEEDLYKIGDSTDFIAGIRNVQSLYLCASTLEVCILIFLNFIFLLLRMRIVLIIAVWVMIVKLTVSGHQAFLQTDPDIQQPDSFDYRLSESSLDIWMGNITCSAPELSKTGNSRLQSTKQTL